MSTIQTAPDFNEEVLQVATRHKKVVTFTYLKGKGKTVEQRRLLPHDVREVKGVLLFTGFDPDRDDYRSYRVDRMRGEVRLS